MNSYRIAVTVALLAALATTSLAQNPVSLIDPEKPTSGWEYGDGPEFPGARGKLEVAAGNSAAETFRDKPVLSLHGDFTDGGNYVQAEVALPGSGVGTLSFWVNSPAGSLGLPIRWMDTGGKVHQLKLKLNDKGGWQQIVLPLDDFFKKMGTPDALDIVSQYETWDGVQDAKRNDKEYRPGAKLAILASRSMGGEKGTLLLSDMLFYPSDENVTSVAKTVRLDELLQEGEIDWGFNLGQEFPGAKGGLDLVEDQPEAGRNAMRLHGDFTGGGAYVGLRRSFEQLDIQAMKVLRIKMRSETAKTFSLRMLDGTGQCHQRKDLPFNADGKWHVVEFVPTEIAGGEHWAGANDGVWHDSIRLVELMLNDRSAEGKTADLLISEITADVTIEAKAKPATFTEDFESDQSTAAWQTVGAVRTDSPGYDGSQKALLLQRALSSLQTETRASSRPFAVGPGMWQVQYASKAKLHSPDNSYHGSIALEAYNAAGKLIETIPVDIVYGEQDWQVTKKTIELPRGASTATLRTELKKTYGSLWLDGLSAAPLSMGPLQRRIERILLATDAVGNLFLPGDQVVYRVTVEAIKPLPEAQRILRYSVRDYWGAEQLPPGQVALVNAPRGRTPFVYSAEIQLPSERLAVGKYYEFHAAIPRETGEPVREFSGLAILPTAVAKQYAAEQIPFTIRNWDSRIGVYFDLADRLGLRLFGVWGGWSADPPYKPHCPGIERCEAFGAKWITGTPAAQIERNGFTEYSEESLRQGMKKFLEQFADRGMAMIAMGNEPHGTGEKVLENVRAYKAIYETVKTFDPKIHVIGTSVEPNEEYFKAGYQNYLDSYDFHIYEHYTNVGRTMGEYRELMEKYGAVKPIHSTELGLNSQGQTRHAVALEMIKKFTVFFAEGGDTVSWFTIQYPDSEGKARGQFGDSHCVFDCKYNLYNPRLDAIVHYNMINGICDKKFVEQRHYPDGVQAYLFRNQQGDCLQLLWSDDARQDVLVPLPAGQEVELVRLDGARTSLRSTTGGISLGVSVEPALLLYHDPQQGLAKTLGTPTLSLATAPTAIGEAATSVFTLTGPGLKAELLRVSCPPLWKTTVKQAGENRVECTARAPDSTPAREARIHIQLLSAGYPIGELTVPIRVARTN